MPVIVILGCHDKVPHAGCLERQKYVFSQSGSWKFENRVLACSVSGESSHSGLLMAVLLRPHLAFPKRREHELSGITLIGTLILADENPMLIASLKTRCGGR